MFQVRCPACCSGLNQKVNSVTPTIASNWFAKEQPHSHFLALAEHIRKLWKTDKCIILKCNECKTRFAWPHVAGDPKFYNLASPNPTYPNSRWEFDVSKFDIIKILEAGGKILEIGGGSGNFLKKLTHLGLEPQRIVATEFSQEAITALKTLGVFVEEVDFREGIPGGPFKVVVLFQTLEHLDQLDDVLYQFRKLTTQDSHLFVSVPNVEYLEWAENTLGIIDMPPNHITGFSQDGLIKLFFRTGWEPQNIHLQTRDSLVLRAKFGTMRGLQYPRNRIQKFLQSDSDSYSSLRLMFSAVILLLTDWSLLKKVPAENILIRAKKIKDFN